jgi:spoIIIJ-associated protein
VANGRTNPRRGGASRGIEVSAKTVDEAIARALEQLALDREEVEIEVLHAGSPGRLLGFGAEPARVRVTPIGGAAAAVGQDEDAEEGDEAAGSDTQRARFGGALPAASAPVARAPRPPRPTPTAEGEEESGEGDENAAGDAELARLMLAELLRRMGMDDCQAEVASVNPLMVNIRGDDVADLIGRRGENLRALQFILSLMVNKQLHRHLRVTIDVDGYRARREELLRSMASRFAYRVRATREPMQLEAMPPNERRIVHLALADDPDVMTESIGEGETRRVVIKPRR